MNDTGWSLRVTRRRVGFVLTLAVGLALTPEILAAPYQPTPDADWHDSLPASVREGRALARRGAPLSSPLRTPAGSTPNRSVDAARARARLAQDALTSQLRRAQARQVEANAARSACPPAKSPALCVPIGLENPAQPIRRALPTPTESEIATPSPPQPDP